MVASPEPDRTDTLADWLILTRAPGVGSVALQHLLDTFTGAREILAATNGQLRSCGLNTPAIAALKQADQAAVDRTGPSAANPLINQSLAPDWQFHSGCTR